MKNIILQVFMFSFLFVVFACEGNKHAAEQKTESTANSAANSTTTTELTVWGMSCVKCVKTVTNAVSPIDGVSGVNVNLRAQRITVEHSPLLDVELIKNAITAQGYNIH